MSPGELKTPATHREQEMRSELKLAYERLTDIASRLLLVNETAEAALSGENRTEISSRFLSTAARGMGVRRAAMFLVEGEGFSLGAAFGLGEEEQEALASGSADIDACQAAVEARETHVVDEQLVAPDALEAIAAAVAAREEAAPEEDEAEDGEGGEEDAGSEEEAGTQSPGAEEAEAVGEDAAEPPFFGVFLPVQLEDEAVAVLALGERAGGAVYRNEDLVFIQYLLRQFALTLHRSTLLAQIQHRLEELDALLKVSREITSTLDLDAVLRSVVNTVGAVVQNDRSEIALVRGGKLVLRAVSGMTRLDPDQAEIFKIAGPLEYLRTHQRRLHLGAEDLLSEPPPAGHDVFAEYFSAQQMRSFMALPLQDDQGLLGFLCLESRQETWDIHPAEGDTLSILAAQTTVAIRNATLYSEIPLRGVSLPVSRLGARFAALTPRGRVVAALASAVTLVALLLPITPERAGGAAEIRPLRFQGVRALTEGVVARALVSGGGEVRGGQTLAVVEDFDLAGRLADLKAQIEVARRDMAAARLAGDVAAWRANEIKLVGLEATLALEEKRARGAVLSAPFAGQVLELDLAQRVGQHLDAGESFCTVAALDVMAVDFEVSEEQIGGVRVGQPVAVKVMSFPTHAFHGPVIEVGWRGHADERGRTRYTVRAQVENPDRRLRPGMTGVAKASVGWRSAASLLVAPLLRYFQIRWL